MTVYDGEGNHALFDNVRVKREQGYAVVDKDSGSCAVVLETGTLGETADTLRVQTGSFLAAGAQNEFTGRLLSIPAAQTEPRKDVIGLNESGDPIRIVGDQEPKDPPNRQLRYAERPAPKDIAEEPIAPLAIVSVPADIGTINETHVRDIRPSADYYAATINGVEPSKLGGERLDPTAAETISGEWTFGGGVKSTQSPVEGNHLVRKTDQDALDATDVGALPSSGGTVDGDLGQSYVDAANSQGYTNVRVGSLTQNAVGYILLAASGQDAARVTGTLYGHRSGNSSTRASDVIQIALGSNQDAEYHGSFTRLRGYDATYPELSFAEVTVEGTPYIALECWVSGNYNYDDGVYFDGLTRHGALETIDADDVRVESVVDIHDSIVVDRFEINGGSQIYHEGNVNPIDSAEFTDHTDAFDAHTAATNPHGVTPEQVGALSIDGGTITGQLSIDGGLTVNGASHATFATHSTTLDQEYTLPAGTGAVIAGELSGTGGISGEGSLAVIDEGIHRAVKNPMESDVNAGGNSITGLGSVGADEVSSQSVETENLNNVVYTKPANNGAGIQAAIDAANPGGTVKLLEGTYTVSSTINLDDVSGVTIRSDHDAVVAVADGFNSQVFNNASTTSVEGVTFEGFEIDGNAANQDLMNATSYYGIGGLKNTDGIVVRDMTFRNITNNAIVVNDGDNHRIHNCRFIDTGHPDASKTAAHIVINDGSGHVISHNEFRRATDNALYTRNDGTVVTGNRFNEVMVYLMDSGSHNQYFLYNDIVGTPKEPVTGTVLTNRRWFRFNQSDITDIYVIGNTLRGLDAECAGFAEATDETVTGLRNIYFEANSIYGNGFATYGIMWNAPVEDFSAVDNMVTQTQRDGIRLNGITRGEIKGNTAYNTNTNGDTFVWPLALGRGVDIPNSHVTVADNRSIDDRATKTHYNGLAIRGNTGSDWVTVHDNIVEGAANAERDIDTSHPHLVYNGLGYNDGPPADGGQWIGEGFEGLTIRDTTNANTYIYNGGVWSQIASA